MWPFNRKKKQANSTDKVPKEVKEYYQSERREKIGIAWLLALGTLVATVVIAIGLFYGGRWVWREVFGKDNNQTATTQQEGQNQTGEPNQAGTEGTDRPSSPPSESTAQPQTTTPSTPSTTPSPPAPATQPGPSTGLTDTGPGDTVAIFIGATIVATLAHEIYTRRRLSR